MDPSKFPTDNLYKFMALCGVVTVVFSYYFWFEKVESINARNYERTVELAALKSQSSELLDHLQRTKPLQEAEDKRLTEDAQAAQKKLEELADLQERNKLSLDVWKFDYELLKRDQERREKRAAVLQEQSDALAKQNDELFRTSHVFFAHSQIDEQVRAQLGRYGWFTSLLGGAGALLALFGFRLWYTRLQRHLDKAVVDGVKPAA